MKCGKGIFIIGAAALTALTTMTLSCVHRPRGEWSELGFLDGNGDGRLDGYEALDILLMFSDDFDGPIPIEELRRSAIRESPAGTLTGMDAWNARSCASPGSVRTPPLPSGWKARRPI